MQTININEVIKNLTKNPNLDETFGGRFAPYVMCAETCNPDLLR